MAYCRCYVFVQYRVKTLNQLRSLKSWVIPVQGKKVFMDSYYLLMANFYLFVFGRMEKHYTKCAGKVMDQKRIHGNPVIIF